MVTTTDRWTDDVAPQVLARLDGEGLRVKPKSVQVMMVTDAFDDEAWRVLLVLPRPSGETWDRDAVFEARRAAISAFDELAAAGGRELPGRTIALVTTDEADDADIATEDEPETGEDPGRER